MIRILLLLLFAFPAFGATKWVDLSGTGTGSANGADVSNLCAGIADADCTPSAGDTVYLCNAAASGTDIDVPASGTSDSARIDYDGSCPGGTPGSLTMGRIFGTGRKYWGVSHLTINGSDSGESAITCFVCETSLGGSCSSREAACEGFRANYNLILDSGKSGIEIGTVSNQSSYSPTTTVQITYNDIRRPAAHGVSMNANMVSPTEGHNTVTDANYTGGYNAWGVYTTPRAYNCADPATGTGCADEWVTTGHTCAGGADTQYKITLGSGSLAGKIDANEVVKQVLVNGSSTGQYTQQANTTACNGSGSGLGLRRWCQDGADLHVCGTELNPPTDNDVVIVTSNFGPVTMGRGDDVSGTKCFASGGACTKDGTGIGGDIGAHDLTIEGAFAHDNEGRGIEFNMCSTGCVARSSISAYNGRWGFLANNTANATDVVSWYNIVAWGNGEEPLRIANAASASVQAYNTIVGGPAGVNCVNTTVGGGEGGNLVQNCTSTYFPTAIEGDPLFLGGLNPTTAEGFMPDCLSSPVKDAGINVGLMQDYTNRRMLSPFEIGPYACQGGTSRSGATNRATLTSRTNKTSRADNNNSR